MDSQRGRARPTDQALVSDQAPAGLDPSGFDLSRVAFLIRDKFDQGGVAVSYISHRECIGEVLKMMTPRGMVCEYTIVPREFVDAGKDWFERTIDKARDCEWVSFASVAQAIEARRAETGTGSVHESAVGTADAPTLYMLDSDVSTPPMPYRRNETRMR